jgi:hypothetical protein
LHLLPASSARTTLRVSPRGHEQAAAGKGTKDKTSKKKDGVASAAAAGAGSGDVEAASIEELHQRIQTLEREKNKEEEYRNYMQLERVRQVVVARCAHALLIGGMLMDTHPCTNGGPLRRRAPLLAGQDQRLLGDHEEGPGGPARRDAQPGSPDGGGGGHAPARAQGAWGCAWGRRSLAHAPTHAHVRLHRTHPRPNTPAACRDTRSTSKR